MTKLLCDVEGGGWTHLTEDDCLDLDSMKRLTEYHVDQKLTTVIATLSTGEFSALCPVMYGEQLGEPRQ